MGRVTVRVMDFQEYDGNAFAAYLEEMAAKGWFLWTIRGGFLWFDRDVPRRVFYLAVARPGSSEMDHVDCEEARAFREPYVQMGWKLQYGGTMWQIFASEQPMPEVLPEKDPETWLQEMKRTMFSFGRLFSIALLVLLMAMRLCMDFRDPVRTLASSRDLLTTLLLALIWLLIPFQYLYRLFWYRKAVRQVRETGRIPRTELSVVKRRSRAYICLCVAFFPMLFLAMGLNGSQIAAAVLNGVVLVVICNLVLYWIQHNGSESRRENAIGYGVGAVCIGWILVMLMTGIFMRFIPVQETEYEPYQRSVEVPVEFEDLGYTFDSYSASNRSFLAAYQREFGQKADGSYLSMTYYQCGIAPALKASRHQFPNRKGTAWEVTETEYPQEDGIRMVRYHCEMAEPERAYTLEKGRDVYVIEDRNRFLVLDYSVATEPEAVAPALNGFRSTGSGK